jgi:prolyl-tRNA editing enzyme YbaK/EbsC (Cys-tRNA(Pro) deacylase)
MPPPECGFRGGTERVDHTAALPRIYINGGKHGYIISLDTSDALRLLGATLVHAAH